MEANEIQGNLWVPLHFGGYVLYHLSPHIRVSIDGRWAMVYPRSVMRDAMTFAHAGTNGRWKRILTHYNADFALVEPGNPALPEMLQDSQWRLLFKEETCGLFVKRAVLDNRDSDWVTPPPVSRHARLF